MITRELSCVALCVQRPRASVLLEVKQDQRVGLRACNIVVLQSLLIE